MGRPRLTDTDLDRIVTMREAGRTYAEIARAIGCSVSIVDWHCLRLGADPPNPRRVRAGIVGPAMMNRGGHVVRRFTDEEDTRLLQLEGQGLGASVIGRCLGRPPNSVRGRLMTLARRDARLEAWG